VSDLTRTEEQIEDIVGAMADAGHGLEYDDAQGLIAATRRGPNPYDAAQTFEESGLTAAHTGTEVTSGSVEIRNIFSNVRMPAQTNTVDTTEAGGTVINPNQDTEELGVRLYDEIQGATRSRVVRVSDSTTLDTVDISGVPTGGTFTHSVSLTSGTDYVVRVDAEGNSYTQSYNSDNTIFPVESDAVDIVDGSGGGSIGDAARNVRGVRVGPNLAGSVILEWPHPTDLYRWDVATFTETPDGETVDVFAAYDDGSGWTRANGGDPISRNYSLADDPDISPSDEVRIEAELSRDDTSNNPTLDSAYRSWVV